METLASHYDLLFWFDNTGELLNDWTTDLVVEGEIISTEFINASNEKYSPTIFKPTTKSILKINRVFKGDLNPGDTIVFIEGGGYAPAKLAYEQEYRTKFPDLPEYDGKDSDVWAYRPMGVPISERGDIGIYFLRCDPWVSHYYDFWIKEGENMYSAPSSGKYKFIQGKAGFKIEYKGSFIPSEEAYVHWLQRNDTWPEPIFTLSDFEVFVEENLGKFTVNRGIRLKEFDNG